MQVLNTPEQIERFRLLVLKRALLTYATTGLLLTRTMTPTALLASAADITGLRYKRGDHLRAAQDIENLLSYK